MATGYSGPDLVTVPVAALIIDRPVHGLAEPSGDVLACCEARGLAPPPPGGPGEDPDCYFPEEIHNVAPISARIRG